MVLLSRRPGARRWLVDGAALMRPDGRKEPLHAYRRKPQPWGGLSEPAQSPSLPWFPARAQHDERSGSALFSPQRLPPSVGAPRPLIVKERRGGRAAVRTMEYGSIDELDKEDAPRQAKRYAVGVVTATALVALGATSAIRTTTSLRATAQNPTGRRVQVHAFADAL